MRLIDTHAHLYAEEFESDIQETLQRAIDSGVERIVLPAVDSKSHDKLIQLYRSNTELFVPVMGVHPTSVKDDYKSELEIAKKLLFENDFFKGVGEMGIDLYWDKTHHKEQIEAFTIQINWAKELRLPVIIHTRDSFNETYELLKPLQNGDIKGIFHCYGNGVDEAKKIVDLGFLLGIGGVVTFKNTDLRETLKHIALKNIVLETDSPYLAPVPKRGKRNESSYLLKIAEKLSEVYSTSVDTIANTTTSNAKALFRL